MQALIGKGGHNQRIELILVGRAAHGLQVALVVVTEIGVINDQSLVEGVPQFLDSIAECVARPEASSVEELIKIHAVVPAVGIVYVFNANVRKCVPNDFGDLGEGMIEALVADVEDFATDESHWGP